MKKSQGKKIVIAVAVLLILALIGITQTHKCIPTLSSSLMPSQKQEKTIELIAHRGLSSLFPQNTLPAFEAAAQAGYYAIELDIHTTADGEWVVIHNDTVDDMTDGSGKVSDFTLDEIKALTIDNGNGVKNLPALTIPALSEVLALCSERNIVPVIEIKSCDSACIPMLTEAIEEYGLSEKAVIISFEKEYLGIYREISPDARIMLLCEKPTMEDVAFCTENGFGLDFKYSSLLSCRKAINEAKKQGLSLGAWTVDNTIYADIMARSGIDFITTNKILPA